MGKMFKKMGYEVNTHFDVKTSKEFNELIDTFLNPIGAGSHVLFFYAGHALEGHKDRGKINVGNALVPTVKTSQRVSLQSIYARLEKKKLASVGFFMDACRVRGAGSRDGVATDSKKAKWVVPAFEFTDVFYSFGCSPGQVCLEFLGAKNGLFTKHLLVELKKPKATLNQALRRVCKQVYKESAGKQRPWYNESITKIAFRL